MVTFVRRAAVLAALLFWQGGFTFYAAVVVPVGQEVLGSHFDQGLITRHVTEYLNLAGVVALLPLAWDASVGRKSCWHRRARWVCLAGLGLTLGLLFWLHPRLDVLLDLEGLRLLNRRSFRSLHRWYLWISTVQWAFALGYVGLALRSWREEDRRAGAGGAPVSTTNDRHLGARSANEG